MKLQDEESLVFVGEVCYFLVLVVNPCPLMLSSSIFKADREDAVFAAVCRTFLLVRICRPLLCYAMRRELMERFLRIVTLLSCFAFLTAALASPLA